jgi:hypothetical protein
VLAVIFNCQQVSPILHCEPQSAGLRLRMANDIRYRLAQRKRKHCFLGRPKSSRRGQTLNLKAHTGSR